MAPQVTLGYPGAIYHLMNRGDRREPIFRDDYDVNDFLERSLKPAPRRLQVHAYCLMSNHFHRWSKRRSQSGGRDEMAFGHLPVASTGATNSLASVSGRYIIADRGRQRQGYLRTVCD